jgi:hypothetical protein
MSKKTAKDFTVLLRTENDQNIALSNDGHYYIFDQSGDTPAGTDDGPLRIDEKELHEIHLNPSAWGSGLTCYIPVIVENRKHPDPKYPVRSSCSCGPIVALFIAERLDLGAKVTTILRNPV